MILEGDFACIHVDARREGTRGWYRCTDCGFLFRAGPAALPVVREAPPSLERIAGELGRLVDLLENATDRHGRVRAVAGTYAERDD